MRSRIYLIHSVTLAVIAETARLRGIDEKPTQQVEITTSESTLTLKALQEFVAKWGMWKPATHPQHNAGYLCLDGTPSEVACAMLEISAPTEPQDLYVRTTWKRHREHPFAYFAKEPKKNHRKKGHR